MKRTIRVSAAILLAKSRKNMKMTIKEKKHASRIRNDK